MIVYNKEKTLKNHYFGAQCLPINRNRTVCLSCGKIINIGTKLTGRKKKCSKTRKYVYLGNGSTGQQSTANGKINIRSRGHAEYRPHFKK